MSDHFSGILPQIQDKIVATNQLHHLSIWRAWNHSWWANPQKKLSINYMKWILNKLNFSADSIFDSDNDPSMNWWLQQVRHFISIDCLWSGFLAPPLSVESLAPLLSVESLAPPSSLRYFAPPSSVEPLAPPFSVGLLFLLHLWNLLVLPISGGQPLVFLLRSTVFYGIVSVLIAIYCKGLSLETDIQCIFSHSTFMPLA